MINLDNAFAGPTNPMIYIDRVLGVHFLVTSYAHSIVNHAAHVHLAPLDDRGFYNSDDLLNLTLASAEAPTTPFKQLRFEIGRDSTPQPGDEELVPRYIRTHKVHNTALDYQKTAVSIVTAHPGHYPEGRILLRSTPNATEPEALFLNRAKFASGSFMTNGNLAHSDVNEMVRGATIEQHPETCYRVNLVDGHDHLLQYHIFQVAGDDIETVTGYHRWFTLGELADFFSGTPEKLWQSTDPLAQCIRIVCNNVYPGWREVLSPEVDEG